MSKTKDDHEDEYLRYAVDDADLKMDEDGQHVTHEPGMPSSMSLDMEAVRRKRAELSSQTKQPTSHEVRRGPRTELGKAIDNVLFNPDYPHPHNIHFKDEVRDLVRRVERMGVGEHLPGASSFFTRHRYVFQSDSDKPVIVMKSLEELEQEQEANRSKICSGYNSDLLRAIGEASKRSKKSKKKNREASSNSSAKQVPVDDDFDMFGGFVGSSESIEKEEHIGQIFDARDENHIRGSDDTKLIREKLIESRLATHKEAGPSEQGDEFFKTSEFGQKLDVSKFQQAETDEDSSKKRKNKDNAIFQKVMKKLDNR